MPLTQTEQLPDQQARDRAVSCFDRPVMVEAAAGTGKTTLLVDRIIAALLDDPRKPSIREIAAITFTEKAAAEMKERLRERLHELLGTPTDGVPARRSQPLTDAQRTTLQQALRELDTAPISTIHAFCMNLLRERPVEAGLDPDARVADPVEQELLFEEAWQKWFERALAHEGPPTEHPIGKAFLVDAQAATNPGSIATRLRRAARRLVENRDMSPDRAVGSVAPLTERLATLLSEHRTALQEMARATSRGKQLKVATFAQEVLHLETLAGELSEAELQKRIEQLSSWKKFDGGNSTRAETRKHYERANQVLADLTELACAKTVGELLKEFVKFIDLYEHLKQQRKLLDFLDLLLKVHRLFTDHPHVCRYFARQYKHLLIDEFQDTDPIQVAIARALVEGVQDRGPSLFVVGDPKQSIYRFRRADIETYETALEKFQKRGGEKLLLTCNFRSVPRILEFVNRVFEPLIKRPGDGKYQPDYVRLDPAPGKRGTKHSGVYLLPPPKEVLAGDWRISELRQIEGYVIGRFICQAVAEGWELHGTEGRKISYGDVAILLERMTDLDKFEEGFMAAGLPYRILGAKQFYRRIELKTVLNVLRALDRPTSPLRVVAAVRSPLFGISDDDLVRHRLKGYPFDFLRCCQEDTPLSGVFRLLRDWYSLRNRLPVHRFLERFLTESAAIEFFAALPRGADRVAALLHLCEEAERLANAGITFKRFVGWLEQRVVATEEETELPEPESDEGAVQVLTIHSAKGLEFPMVVLAGFCSRYALKVDPPLRDENGGFQFAFSSRLRTQGWRAAEELELRRLNAERIRLLYVACTRAKDFLVLPVNWPYKKGNGKPMQEYLPEKWRELLKGDIHAAARQMRATVVDTSAWGRPPRVQRHPRVRPEDLCREEVSEGARRLQARASELETRAEQVTEKSRSGLRIIRPSELVEASAVPEGPPSVRPHGAGDGASAIAVGALVHELLQLAVGQGVSAADLAGRLGQWVEARAEARGLTAERAERALELARNVLANQRLEQWLANGTAHTEVPVAASRRCDGAGNGQELIEGTIDLLIELPEGVVILIDYKTDAVRPGAEHELLDRYRPQLLAYVEAVRKALPGRRIEPYLAVAETGHLLSVDGL